MVPYADQKSMLAGRHAPVRALPWSGPLLGAL